MKYPLGYNELGYWSYSDTCKTYWFCRTDSFDTKIHRGLVNCKIGTWKEFKETYPIECGHILCRKRI